MDASDAAAARAIERQMEEMRERVQRGGVMEYRKPLGVGVRKDVNKVFLSSTIRSVDSHNRRHEEEKCWKIRELERKLDDRHGRRRERSRSRSFSPSSRRYHRPDRRRERSRSRGRHRGRRSRSCSRSRDSHHTRRDSSARDKTPTTDVPATVDHSSDTEREYWATKKAEKTKKMWENVYAGTSSVLVTNAPEYSSQSESDDEDERVHDEKKHKTHKKEKKHKKHKKEKKHKRSP